jgi:hypothetical protein
LCAGTIGTLHIVVGFEWHRPSLTVRRRPATRGPHCGGVTTMRGPWGSR